jgi:hypothetical protein
MIAAVLHGVWGICWSAGPCAVGFQAGGHQYAVRFADAQDGSCAAQQAAWTLLTALQDALRDPTVRGGVYRRGA